MTEEEEYFEERAAIMEYDGGLSRDKAEDAAMGEMKKKYICHLKSGVSNDE